MAKTDLIMCDACKHPQDPKTLVRETSERTDLALCRDPIACRMRAQKAGIYMAYQPATG